MRMLGRTILRRSRPIYRLGTFVLKTGMMLTSLGLIVGLSGKGWIICLIGSGCVLAGVFIGQAAEVSLTGVIKHVDWSITANQAHDLDARYLQARDDEADDLEVFLGELVGEVEYQERQ